MRPWPPVSITLATLLLLTGCSNDESTSFADCPITVADEPTPSEIRFQNPVPWVREETGWFGNPALWVSLPPDGVVPAMPSDDEPEVLHTKFAWWRLSPGLLTAEAQRSEGGEVLQASVPAGYGQTGFNPSGLVFDGEGCWQVTGRVGDESLSFVVWVCETEFFPDVVPAGDREACGAAVS